MFGTEKKRFFVSGVCCSTEETLLRKKLDTILEPGAYTFNPVTSELSVNAPVDEEHIFREVRTCGFNARSKRELEEEESFWQRHADGVYTATAGILAVCGMLIGRIVEFEDTGRLLLLAAIAIGGWKIFLKAFKATRSLVLDMNVLMSLAVIGALAIGKWEEGAAVIVLFSVSLMLESYSISRTRKAVQSLLKVSPDQAGVMQDGKEVLVSAKDVAPGSLIRIRPGERIPLDGDVIEGSSTVDESPITGEPDSVPKVAGASVYAGSINHHGSLSVKVTKCFEDTTLARMLHLVQEAQHARAPIQTFVDRFARVYTPVVLAIALVVAIVPPLALEGEFGTWLYRALVLLVIACPCALVISTPVTIVSALTAAARRGTLIKGGTHIETLSKVRTIAFDKTGTLTQGKPRVTDIIALNSFSQEKVLELIAAIEQHSEHHLADAVLVEAARRSIRYDSVRVDGFEALPGKGVKATIDGTRYYLGNQHLSGQPGSSSSGLAQTLDHIRSEGKSVIILSNDREAVGMIAVKDTARDQSRKAVDDLRRVGVRRMVMLSGDHDTPARQLAHDLGIDETRAELLPERKVTVIEALRKEHGIVAMVGDGINDAPALAASSVGIAMGVSGTDAALETADVVLTSDDLSRLPSLLQLSRKAMSIVKQNIVLALSLKLVFLALSVASVATLWMAVLADDGAALIVILNGLRLLSSKT